MILTYLFYSLNVLIGLAAHRCLKSFEFAGDRIVDHLRSDGNDHAAENGRLDLRLKGDVTAKALGDSALQRLELGCAHVLRGLNLDGDFAAALRTCKSKKLVTSHAAFAYLADRFGLQQVAISGLSPEAEPDPARLAAISDYVKANKVTTIYTETLVSPALAETLAKETGASTAVLDPLEGLNDSTPGANYLSVMRTNLATLEKGQQCA